ncbi:uncharacterized protein MELLADRAFT_67903 [Melampsora larici-populina 98AG31]|uniref:Uncharacterized protein n=1 Tax=Melampsora larici-populina (strain 98AG31 / pathotype 3-4-7) TaxID=747676 RepID=F4S4W1_MELLP|nr:uncharacterized protein MELLADRAFT_67903 [Melampsora larici-populina 98AG31]EGG00360.1 hypothetical protein MELLADRAFT_67903 [Melampsora larici-populina 98AG31]
MSQNQTTRTNRRLKQLPGDDYNAWAVQDPSTSVDICQEQPIHQRGTHDRTWNHAYSEGTQGEYQTNEPQASECKTEPILATPQHKSPAGPKTQADPVQDRAHKTGNPPHQDEEKDVESDDWPNEDVSFGTHLPAHKKLNRRTRFPSQAVTAREGSEEESGDSSSDEEPDLKPVPVTMGSSQSFKIEVAKEQYSLIQNFYTVTKENMEGVLASSDPALIGKEINLMTSTLKAIQQSVRSKEKKLNAAINAKHPEVTIIERAMSPLILKPKHPDTVPALTAGGEDQAPGKPTQEAEEGVVLKGDVETHLRIVDSAAGNHNTDGNGEAEVETQPGERLAADVEGAGAGPERPVAQKKRAVNVRHAPTTTKPPPSKRNPAAGKFKSAEFVDDKDMPSHARNATTSLTNPPPAPQAANPPTDSHAQGRTTAATQQPRTGPPTASTSAAQSAEPLGEVVVPTEKKKARGKKGQEEERPAFRLEVNKNHKFHKAKIYLGNLLMNKTPKETQRILAFEDQMPTGQYQWGEVLSYPVRTILHEWSYDEATEAGRANADDLHKFVLLMKDMTDDDKMSTQLKSSPCLMQIHQADPIWRPENINWALWGTDAELLKDLNGGFQGLFTCLQESLDHITLDTDHHEITIVTEGEDSVHEDFVELSKSMAWLFRGAMVSNRPEVDGKKSSTRNPHRGLAWLKRKFFLVLVGVLMVYEAKQQDLRLERAKESRMPQAAITKLKAQLKDNSCIKQFVREQVKVKRLAIKGDAPSAIEGDGAPTERDHTRALSEFRRSVMQHMAVFLAFGTAGLFHVWPGSHDQNGVFKTEVNWPTMTDLFRDQFDATKLAHVLTLDMQCEICLPGQSRSLTGAIAPPVKDKDKAKQLLRPSQVQFCKMFGPTEGDLHPVSKRGEGLHPEKQASKDNPSTSTFTPQDKSAPQQTQVQSKGAGGAEKRASTSWAPVVKKKRKLVNATSEKAGNSATGPSQDTQASQQGA